MLREHRVEPGQNLSTISNQYYGTPCHALVIYQANTDKIASPNQVYPGQVLVIPHITDPHPGGCRCHG